MRVLIISGSYYPDLGNNANLLSKLLPFLAEHHNIRILSTTILENTEELPAFFRGFPVYWIDRNSVSNTKQQYLFPIASKVMDPHGNSDVLNVKYIQEKLKQIKVEFDFDAIVSTSEPYPAAIAAASTHCEKKVLYLMDPPELVRNEAGTKYRTHSVKFVLNGQTTILTTPFIRDALLKAGLQNLGKKIVPVGFPMIKMNAHKGKSNRTGKICLLFCGWMCSQIRSPKYFLDIVSRLDERFEVTFMGKECELLHERFPIETKATLITLPNQPYDVALQSIADVDVLINIGNSVPVHMPSKTLEYINTGKPMVNFYKFADCPTLYYTKRYPLALNMFEEEKDMDAATARFVRFCEENIGKTVNHEWIVSEYADCTPQYIAQMILDSLEK